LNLLRNRTINEKAGLIIGLLLPRSSKIGLSKTSQAAAIAKIPDFPLPSRKKQKATELDGKNLAFRDAKQCASTHSNAQNNLETAQEMPLSVNNKGTISILPQMPPPTSSK